MKAKKAAKIVEDELKFNHNLYRQGFYCASRTELDTLIMCGEIPFEVAILGLSYLIKRKKVIITQECDVENSDALHLYIELKVKGDEDEVQP